MITIEDVLVSTSQSFTQVGIEDARLEAELMLATYMNISRARLLYLRDKTFLNSQDKPFVHWVTKRQQRIPLAYIAEEQPFGELVLKVNPAVLVPRPETELLVERARHLLDAMPPPVMVIDVGTGSGNIALSLADHHHIQRLLAIDISKDALRTAQENAGRLLPQNKIEWLQSHLLSGVDREEHSVELIVANLPYVKTSDLPTLERELHWEPQLALDGGPDGLRLIEPCIAQAGTLLRASGVLLLEIGAEQARDVVQLFEKDGVWKSIQVHQDFSGWPRLVEATRKGT